MADNTFQISGNALGSAICEAMGLNAEQIEQVVVTCRGGALATVDVTFTILDVDAPASASVPLSSGHVLRTTIEREVRRFTLAEEKPDGA
jgi:hypothetical protein